MAIDINSIIKEAYFRDENLPYPAPVITIQEKIICTKGNFITINGLPKSRKTTFMQFFIYSALTGRDCFGMRVNIDKNDRVLLIDTEQSIHDFSRQNNQLKRMLGADKMPERFSAYLFRQYEPETILNAIYLLVTEQRPKILFIDNLTELVLNPNDIPESKKVIQLLKKLTAEFDLCIVCLLHLGKTNLNTLGNLGSLADRAAQSVLKVTADKDSGTSILDASMLRSAAFFEPITIYYNTNTNFYEQTETNKQSAAGAGRKKFILQDLTEAEHIGRLNAIFAHVKELSYAELIEQLKRLYGVGANIAKQQIAPYLTGNGFIIGNKGIYKRNK